MQRPDRGDKKRVPRAEAVVHSRMVYSVLFVRAFTRTGRLRQAEVYHAIEDMGVGIWDAESARRTSACQRSTSWVKYTTSSRALYFARRVEHVYASR